MRAIRKHIRPFLAIIGLIAIAVAVGGYILVQQGQRIPFFEKAPVHMTAVLETAQGITPGQGQTVQVAGVQVGKIADVHLSDGRAVLDLDMDRDKVDDGLIRTDARALLRPRTPLKDMYLQLFPGSWKRPAAGKGFQIPLQGTLTDVNFDEVLSQLDARTRDYLAMLVSGTGEGLKGRGSDLAEVFRRFGPTARDLGRVNRSVANERVALRAAVSEFAQLSRRLAEHPEQLSRLVSASSDTFGAFASEDASLKDTIRQLPGTLRRATVTLQRVQPLANALGPATRALTPAVGALRRANPGLRALGREATPIVRTRIRPFVRAARPLVQDLRPAAQQLDPSFTELKRDTAVLEHLFNMLGYNKDGAEPASKGDRDEGYLFWLAWATHQGENLINVDDANGPMRPIFLAGSCATLTSLVNFMPQLEFGMALSPLLASVCGNPQTASVGARAKLSKGGKVRFVKGGGK